jgi:hypothetical protein
MNRCLALGLILYTAAVLVAGRFTINARVCRAGLSTCDLGFGVSASPMTYLASRRLDRNELVATSDLEAPKFLPAGALHLMPARNDMIGRYVRESVAFGATLKPDNLSKEPVVSEVAAQCLAFADLGAYASVTHLLRPGRQVVLSCGSSDIARCNGAGEWTVVALAGRAGGANGHRVLVTADSPHCLDPSPLIVVGLRGTTR